MQDNKIINKHPMAREALCTKQWQRLEIGCSRWLQVTPPQKLQLLHHGGQQLQNQRQMSNYKMTLCCILQDSNSKISNKYSVINRHCPKQWVENLRSDGWIWIHSINGTQFSNTRWLRFVKALETKRLLNLEIDNKEKAILVVIHWWPTMRLIRVMFHVWQLILLLAWRIP